jgi:hypothetical protein
MATPIKWRSKILLFKMETAYGEDANPSAAANAILATDVQWTPMEGNDVSRDLETPYLGGQPTIASELHAKLSFKVELAPSGTAGTAPAWAPIMRACAVAEVITAATSVVYNPVSDAHESGTFYLTIGGTRYVMFGARGNVKITMNAQGIVYLEFSFTGLYDTPSEQARATPALNAYQTPQIASQRNTPTFTLNAITPVLRSLSLDLGNQVETRFLIGSEGVLITDKMDMVELTIEALPLTTINPFTLAENQTAVPLQLVHGTGAGRISTLDIPRLQMQRPQGLSNAQGIKEWPLRGVPLPDTGNDQWTLTLT